MKRITNVCSLALFAGLFIGLAACDGGSSSVGSGTADSGRPELLRVQHGRLVDIYSYRRINPNLGDRRNRFNRQLVKVAANVVVDATLESQPLYTAGGEEVVGANFQFQPFDIRAGHESLVILWDDTHADEMVKFEDAMRRARDNLAELPASYRGQNTATRPIPVAPRNAAFKLTFSDKLNVDASFFAINPAAVQLLEFKGDPRVVSPVQAFRSLPFRTLVADNTLILDTTIFGGEGPVGGTVPGMPASTDSVTANIRIALPSRGAVSSLFYVRSDSIPELNGIDSFGRECVIRDFRSGNLNDGRYGAVSDLEPPMLISSVAMGIVELGVGDPIVRVNRRSHAIPVRGRFPFVDGAIDPATGLPLGPGGVPTQLPLRSGDFLTQAVQVLMPSGGFETVMLRAEILQNLEVGTVRNDPAFPGTGLATNGTPNPGTTTLRLRLESLVGGYDSIGRPVTFQANNTPDGQDCVVIAHYYEEIKFLDGANEVSDRDNRIEFMRIDPTPIGAPPGTEVSPFASVALQFSEPMDIDRVDNTKNLMLTNSTFTATNFGELIQLPKPTKLSVVPSRLSDVRGDGTMLQLQPQMGFHHATSATETYWTHIQLGSAGLADYAGNPLEIFGDTRNPPASWSTSFTLAPTAPQNLALWVVYMFENVDEDGTPPGSVDMFGQFRIQDGKLMGAETVRFNRQADQQNLSLISRVTRGECWWEGDPTAMPPIPPQTVFPTNPNNGGLLYWQPRMVDVNPLPPAVFLPPMAPQPVGLVIEPHQPRGSRLQMRYIEDDFSLSYRQPAEFMLDVEQLYWSPFNDAEILFDVFDRYSMSLSHADKRPDQRYSLERSVDPPECWFRCPSASSSLGTVFGNNQLQDTSAVTVFENKVYTINPNFAFRAPTGTKFMPYPRFDRSYTWRDSRLVTVNNQGQVRGLGGAQDPLATTPGEDMTANIDCPWIGDIPEASFTGPVWVMDEHSDPAATDFFGGDFIGDRRRDHDPIALPLLVDFKMFPDDAANGFSTGINAFQIAMMGPPSNFAAGNPGGYYNSVGVGCPTRDPWPLTRVHTTGGIDPITGQNRYVDPANVNIALGGVIKDAGLGDPLQGLFQTPVGDAHVHWAQADFVRRMSVVTFGFIDTLQPNRHNIGAAAAGSWTGLGNLNGFPNAVGLEPPGAILRVQDLMTQLDPPISRQPAGTSVVVEFRGVEDFDNPTVYDRTTEDKLLQRGNLLNPNYACDAYRYSTPNSGGNLDLPRVNALNLTKYVTEDRLDEIRMPTQLLPRYLNMRIVMGNNVTVAPALSPSLKSVVVVYRLGAY